MLSVPVYNRKEKKKEGFARLVQPMYAKTRTWGIRPGGYAGERTRDLLHNQTLPDGFPEPFVFRDRNSASNFEGHGLRDNKAEDGWTASVRALCWRAAPVRAAQQQPVSQPPAQPEMKPAPATPIAEKKDELGQQSWDPQWDEIVERALSPEMLSNSAAREVRSYCPRFATLSDGDKRAFWAYTFQALAGAEAGLKPTTNVRHTEPEVAVQGHGYQTDGPTVRDCCSLRIWMQSGMAAISTGTRIRRYRKKIQQRRFYSQEIICCVE